MSAATSSSTISRQWELLKLLPARAPGIEAKALTSQLNSLGYPVSKRTVERDLDDLSRLFPLQCNNKSKPYGWYWMPGASVDLPGINLYEALTLRIVEDTLRPLLPAAMLQSLEARFSQAARKLDALSKELPTARWLDKVATVSADMVLPPPQLTNNMLETVQQALLNERQLQVMYAAVHQQAVKNYTLNPLALVQRGKITYLIATVARYQNPLRFALHRFKQVELLPNPAKKPENFTLQGYLATGAMQFSEGEQILLEAEIDQILADILEETPLSDDMQLTRLADTTEGSNKCYRLSATVFTGWQLIWWLMSHSGSITVQAPDSLRQTIKQRLNSAIAAYQD